MGRGEPQLVANIAESTTCSVEKFIGVEINSLDLNTFGGVSTKVVRSLVAIVVSKLESKDKLIISVDLDGSHIRYLTHETLQQIYVPILKYSIIVRWSFDWSRRYYLFPS